MPAPSSSLATLRPDLAGSLEEFNLEMDRQGFIGHRVLPVLDVGRASGSFGRIPIEQLLQNRDTLRAPGAGYSRGKWTFVPDSYATQEHGAEEPVDDNESAMYADYFDAELVSTQRAFDVVLRNMEKRAAALLFNATTWTGSALTTTISNEWDDATNATPIADIKAARQKVWDGSGLWPNALIINRKVFHNLRDVDEIIDRLKYSGLFNPDPSKITAQALASVFDLEEVIVAGSPKNTAGEGSLTIAPIWSDEYAMLAKIVRTKDIREPGVGRTLHWAEDGSTIGGTVETYRDETVRGDVVRVRNQVQEKVLYTEAAHLLSNVTT